MCVPGDMHRAHNITFCSRASADGVGILVLFGSPAQMHAALRVARSSAGPGMRLASTASRHVPMMQQATISVWPEATLEIKARKPRAVIVTTAYSPEQAEDWFAAYGPPPAADVLTQKAIRPRAYPLFRAKSNPAATPAASRPLVVGFDCEETPHMHRRGPKDGLATMQLAYGDRVLILPVRQARQLPPSVAALMGRDDIFKVGVGIDDDIKTLSSQLQTPCTSFFELSLPHTIAVLAGTIANSSAHDIGNILSVNPDNALPMQLRLGGLVGADTGHRKPRHDAVARDGLLGDVRVSTAISRLPLLRRINKISLVRLAEHWCGIASWKRSAVQTSDWGSLPLSARQTRYAAMDAWAGSAIADALATAGVLDSGLAAAISERS